MALGPASNRSTSGASAQRTYALIVAADAYQMSDPNWSLPTARAAALDIVRWLLSQNVPPTNIHLLTATERDSEIDGLLPSSQWKRPSFTNIDKVLTEDLSGRAGDLLFVFWSGHGEMSRRDKRLYLPEMTDSSRYNVSAARLLECLGTSVYRFPEQVVIFDACAGFKKVDLAEPQQFTRNGHEVSRNLFSVSSRDGHKSTAGTLGPALLAELKKANWPPPFADLCNNLLSELPGLEVELPGKKVTPQSIQTLGSNLHLRCDREKPIRDFDKKVQEHLAGNLPGPMVSIVYGREDQKPDSLVTRLIEIVKVNCNNYSGHHFQVPLEGDEDEQQFRDVLREKLALPAPPSNAAALQQHFKSRRELPVVIIGQVIQAWKPVTTQVLANYLRFWAEWPQDPSSPPVFVFLESMDPFAMRHTRAEQILAFFRRKAPQDGVCRAVQRAGYESKCHIIGPQDLSPVKRGHLHAFHKEHEVALEDRGLSLDDLLAKVFGDKEQTSMREVEAKLRKELQVITQGAYAR